MIEALQCALAGGDGGRAYFVTDPEPTTFRDFVALSHKEPPLSRALVRMIGREFSLDDAAARSSLGYAG